jgi:hypothetical protein
MKRFLVFLLRTFGKTGTVLVLAVTVVGQVGAPSSGLTFASGKNTKVYKISSVGKLPLGPAEWVCLNSSNPINCSSLAVLYGYNGDGWLADLSSCVPEAVWIYAPGTLGSTSPAQNTDYYFRSKFFVSGTPTGGTLCIAADDKATIFVNGVLVGTIGSTTDPTLASDAQNYIHYFPIASALLSGTNIVIIHLENGPATFGGCPVPDDYSCNPSGVVYGGVAKW